MNINIDELLKKERHEDIEGIKINVETMEWFNKLKGLMSRLINLKWIHWWETRLHKI